jgi:hypothetical protein
MSTTKMLHQKVTAVLRNAGFVARKRINRHQIDGYCARQWGRSVGILCGPYPVSGVKEALEAAGLTVSRRNNTSDDCIFVN